MLGIARGKGCTWDRLSIERLFCTVQFKNARCELQDGPSESNEQPLRSVVPTWWSERSCLRWMDSLLRGWQGTHCAESWRTRVDPRGSNGGDASRDLEVLWMDSSEYRSQQRGEEHAQSASLPCTPPPRRPPKSPPPRVDCAPRTAGAQFSHPQSSRAYPSGSPSVGLPTQGIGVTVCAAATRGDKY